MPDNEKTVHYILFDFAEDFPQNQSYVRLIFYTEEHTQHTDSPPARQKL